MIPPCSRSVRRTCRRSTRSTRESGGTTRRAGIVTALFAFAAALALAATPPAQVNYQGVLRSASDAPLTGSYDMVFSFWDASSGGNEILDDAHTAAGGSVVGVSNGLFNVTLGGGTVTDGPGPGSYASLDQVFRDYAAVWLQVKVGNETLNPRTPIVASAYALNASNVGGKPAATLLDTSASTQTKSGPLAVNATGAVTAVTGLSDSVGGQFGENNGNSTAFVGYNAFGIQGYGKAAGGFFKDTTHGAYAYLGRGGEGVYGVTIDGYYGGAFESLDSGGAVAASAYIATSSGALGDGGDFNAGSGAQSAYADVAYCFSGSCSGINATGNASGGYFNNSSARAYAYLAHSNAVGVEGYGSWIGGFFNDTDPGGAYADLGYGTYTVTGNGVKGFRQNHPTDPNRVIVYAALEGNEVGTYTRGSAQLVNGAARIALDPTFAWTTNPDVGLTASVTARGSAASLWVDTLSTKELVVRGPAGSVAAFDYVVFGLRIGLEELPIVQAKDMESPIPSIAPFADQYRLQPELRAYDALERFRTMRTTKATLDLTASRALAASINAQTPADRPAGIASGPPNVVHPQRPGAVAALASAPEAAPARAPSTGASTVTTRAAAAPVLTATTIAVTTVRVAEAVEPGAVLAADPSSESGYRRSAQPADPLVAGIAVAAPEGTTLDPGQADLAYAGAIVPCNADATYGPIAAGDLLTTSATPGFAMRAGDAPRAGTIVGKALEPLPAGRGTIRVQAMAR